jgi:hypothetical protein|tara:strand:- start:33 stop:308 length:276 start_codon:yes stop_codon:yes gene_type:complete
MKKLISILFLGLFWCANAYSIGAKEAAQAKLLNRFKFAIEMVIFFLIISLFVWLFQKLSSKFFKYSFKINWWYVFVISIVLKISIQELMKI